VSTDLIAFLRARLDEAEAARAYRLDQWTPEAHESYCPGDEGCICGRPAFVLADIAAKRAILDLHGGLSACPVCISDREGRYPEDWRNDQTPCQTVRLLAEPFADHLDYQATWRPQ